MLKKLLGNLLGNHSSSTSKYRKYSSSDYRHRKFSSSDDKHRKSHGSYHGQGHSSYGSSHYKKKRSSRSFFSS
ncbi:hypothetical protein [Brevibacillus reuszeri]|uniref:hypothetical protein n=1 Tax=Brevibacillus reuszeri TaxID=54915 RepID=UPI000A04820E|nr:hypothetical protein [Brevibacillus reuszeri]MED1859284.1 hypothetical protein [Brevibacillus reuszeri]